VRLPEEELTRRRLAELGLALPPFAALAQAADAIALPLPATPAIADPDEEPTPSQTEGPFFTPRSPRRRSIVPRGAPGTRLTLSGRVLTTRGRPIANAQLDFWQADARGVYDNSGYRFRGHQRTDARGRYMLHTVVPGLYSGRTRHIHLKAQAPRRPVLTTQLYFPGVSANASDGLFDAELLLRSWRRAGERRVARFDFVLDVG
jgi:protocatechuate 3,4-dioxygenase beta subunit